MAKKAKKAKKTGEEKEVVLQELHKTRIVSESVMPFVARTSGYISRQNIR